MASIAITMVWAWACPFCGQVVKGWKQKGTEYHALTHLNDTHSEVPYDHRKDVTVIHRTWAFNVIVGDLDD